jgi:hypothetical protein
LKTGAVIWFLILSGACFIPVSAQEPGGGGVEVMACVNLAIRDAEHEHKLVFAKSVDEADYWNDQRAFEQQMLERNPAHYRSYLQGKKKSYLKHKDTCGSGCSHGDYYHRQASFYLQYDSGEKGPFLTLIQSENTKGWEVSYAIGKQHRN